MHKTRPLQKEEQCYTHSLPSQEKRRYLWAGSSSCFSPCTACTKAFPGARSQVCTPPPTSVPKGHLKQPRAQDEPLLVLHLAHTPALGTCAARELTDLAGMEEAASLCLSPSQLQRKHLVLSDSAEEEWKRMLRKSKGSGGLNEHGRLFGRKKKICQDSREVLQIRGVCPQRPMSPPGVSLSERSLLRPGLQLASQGC